MAVKVLHSIRSWLPITQVWLHDHLKKMDSGKVKNYIFCEHMENISRFSLPHISVSHNGLAQDFFLRVCRRLGYNKAHSSLQKLIHRESPQVLHSHFGLQGWYDMRAAKAANIKHVVSFYGADVSVMPNYKIWLNRYKDLFEHVDYVYCEGPFMKSALEKLGCKPEKVLIKRLGVDLKMIPFKERQRNADDPIRFLISSSFREKKGIPFGLMALELIAASYPISITVIGDAGPEKESQEEKKKILEIANRGTLKSKIKFLGYLEHEKMIKQAYDHDFFISPSITASNGDTEGGAPVSIIEMAASGLPVISTKHCDIPFVLGAKNRDLLVNEKDVQGLANVIETLIKNQELCKEIALDNRKYIEENLDLNICAKQMAEVFVINEKGSSL